MSNENFSSLCKFGAEVIPWLVCGAVTVYAMHKGYSVSVSCDKYGLTFAPSAEEFAKLVQQRQLTACNQQ